MNTQSSPVLEVLSYLRGAGVFYLATCEGDQPRVRPFSAAAEFEGRLYLITGNFKKCFGQMKVNPKVEISAMGKDNTWIRVEAKVVSDGRREARQRMMEENPGLERLYDVDDGRMEVLYLTDATATVYNGRGAVKELKF